MLQLALLRETEDLIIDGEKFKVGKFYRYLYDETSDFYYINGMGLRSDIFNKHFEDGYLVIKNEFKELGLIDSDDKPLTKKALKELISFHGYGKLRVGFIYKSPKELIYGFYGRYSGDTKAKFFNDLYCDYLNFVSDKDMTLFDNKIIQRGNCGIPICYNNLRFRKF